jgi:DNA-binding NarL/FixJ family response regulator
LAEIRVLIVEDEPLAQCYLTEVVEREPTMEIVGVVADGREVVSQVLSLRPDVVLLDLYLPGINGLAVMQQLVEQGATAQVLVLTADSSDTTTMHAFRAGARGFLPKVAASRYLTEAIRVVAAGETWIDRRTTGRLIEELNFLARKVAETEQPDAGLSEREREVLRCIGRGLTNAQIAAELFLSERTVKVHVSHILQKLQVANRLQAALMARRSGLVPEDRSELNEMGPPTARPLEV